MHGHQETVYTKQSRIAKLAEVPDRRLVSLNHYVDMAWLHEAFRRTRKNGAPGVDGQSGEDYARDLDANLESLLNRAKSGNYVAPPVRRAYIPKDGHEKRPLGVTAFEDKVLQRAWTMILEPIYEHDFLDSSHGFRPNRSAHTALAAVWRNIMDLGGCWLIDADISKFFDTLDKRLLRQFLDQRVGDGVIRRIIGKWLSAGVMENHQVHYPETGTPQGGVISPMLANIFLHNVLDIWFEQTVKLRLKGQAWMVRYADDFIMGFELEEDAIRVFEVLPKRFAKHNLKIHPEKTRLMPFFPPGPSGEGGATFNFVGFTHCWGSSRKGKPYVKRQTMRKRLTRSLDKIREFCRRNRSNPIPEQWQGLDQRMRGHYAYFGITGNFGQLSKFFSQVQWFWCKWLNRRSARRDMTWEGFRQLRDRFPLPKPRIVHSVYAQ